MVVLVTCQNEDDPIINEGARVFKTLYINFSDAQGQITLELVDVSGQYLNSSKLSCMSLLPAKMKMIESKIKELEWSQHFFHYNSFGDISRRSRAANSPVLCPICPNFELIRDVIVILVTCKFEEDPIKMKTLGCSQHFPYYKPIGAIRCHGNQSSNPIWPKTKCSLFLARMMLQIKFG